MERTAKENITQLAKGPPRALSFLMWMFHVRAKAQNCRGRGGGWSFVIFLKEEKEKNVH